MVLVFFSQLHIHWYLNLFLIGKISCLLDMIIIDILVFLRDEEIRRLYVVVTAFTDIVGLSKHSVEN